MRRFKHFTGYPVLSPLDVPFAGRGGTVSGPRRRRFIFPAGGLMGEVAVPVLPAGKIGQGKATAPLEKPAGTPLPIGAGLGSLGFPAS